MKEINKIFTEIYEMCTEQLDSGKYDSILLDISTKAHKGMELSSQNERVVMPSTPNLGASALGGGHLAEEVGL